MTRNRLLMPAVVALAIAMASGSAFAQSNRDDRQNRSRARSTTAPAASGQNRGAERGQSRGVAVRRAAPGTNEARASEAGPRGQTTSSNGPATSSRPANRNGQAAGNGGFATSARPRNGRGQTSSGGFATNARPRNGNGQTANNGGFATSARPGNRGGQGNNAGFATSRRYDNRGGDARYGNPGYGYDRGRSGYAWRSRIRYGLGVSVFAGRPFAFRFDYGWRPSFTYRYPIRYGVAYGGMSFLLDPDYAEVYIDGLFVGIARDFGGQPVPVAAGFHRIELYAPGFEPVAFDINVFPGQVIPYRGSLYPIY